MKNTNSSLFLISSLLCAALFGCAGNETPPRPIPYFQPINQQAPDWGYRGPMFLASIPNGAKILINGTYRGDTPAKNLAARRGDSVTIYAPGYEASSFSAESDGTLCAEIPLLPSDRRLFSLLSDSSAKFVMKGGTPVLESSGASAGNGANFVIYDASAGRDVALGVLESNETFIRFRSDDGGEFCYPVSSPKNSRTARIGGRGGLPWKAAEEDPVCGRYQSGITGEGFHNTANR